VSQEIGGRRLTIACSAAAAEPIAELLRIVGENQP